MSATKPTAGLHLEGERRKQSLSKESVLLASTEKVEFGKATNESPKQQDFDLEKQGEFDIEMEPATDDEQELPDAPMAPIHPSLLDEGGQLLGTDQLNAENNAAEEESQQQSSVSNVVEGPSNGGHLVPNSPPYSPSKSFEGCSHISNYGFQQKIGAGTFGEVNLGVDKRTGKRVALKRILIHNNKEGMPMTAMREIRILKRLSHPHIIRLNEIAVKHGSRERKERASTFMVFPYMEHDLDGLLQNPLVRFNPAQVKSYIKQILLGIEHLHKNLILHRDIKSANILINNKGYLKLADFGLARPFNFNGGKYTNMVVTRWFRPPELLMGATEYDGAVDMWGVGCVFGEILKRRAILPGTSDMDQLNLIWTLCGTPNETNWPGKSYLQLPMFTEGEILDFDESNKKEKTLGEKFPAHHFKPETYNLLDDLLQICPLERLTATDALKSKYFTVLPDAAKPGTSDFTSFSDSHELDSRNAKLSRIESGAKFVLSNHFDVAAPTRKHTIDGNNQVRRVKPRNDSLEYGGF